MLRIYAVLFIFLSTVSVGAVELNGEIRVIDGDTFDIDGARVRLHAVDAPEPDQMCQTEHGVAWACGAWISKTVSNQYDGVVGHCETQGRDKYNRFVAVCDVQGQDVGEWLVSQGYAFAYLKYGQVYATHEQEAAKLDRGLHALRLQTPAQHRLTRVKGRIPKDRACAIKGNISFMGVKIYHLPGQAFYEQTGIRTERGEQWFCSTAAAEMAGWRAAKR